MKPPPFPALPLPSLGATFTLTENPCEGISLAAATAAIVRTIQAASDTPINSSGQMPAMLVASISVRRVILSSRLPRRMVALPSGALVAMILDSARYSEMVNF